MNLLLLVLVLVSGPIICCDKVLLVVHGRGGN
jgi:hypothetical protein